jgi:hypothetical protein
MYIGRHVRYSAEVGISTVQEVMEGKGRERDVLGAD